MNFWRSINILSIDIALGAVASCSLFAAVFGVSLLPQAYLSLGLIVWLIYTIDHLLDASRAIESLSTERHRFHRKHRVWLTGLVVIVGLTVAIQVFLVRTPVLVAALTVSVLVAVYLVLQRKLNWLKEATGALLYSAGVVIAPASLLSRPIQMGEWLLICLFMLTAFINLLICSLYDIEKDVNDGQPSFATSFGESRTRQVIRISFMVVSGFLILSLFAAGANKLALAILISMNVALWIVFERKGFFSMGDRHRLLADLAFLFPMLYPIVDGFGWI